MAPPLVVFCDFDGTMTEKDVIVQVVEKFCPGDWRPIVDQIVNRTKTVKDGVAELFARIPSALKDEIIAYTKANVRWRSGLEEFLRFCKTNGLRFVVCSGGVDFFSKPLLERFREYIDDVYIIPAEFDGPTIRLRHELACETEGTCKVKVMERYPDSIRILIGDGITDLHGATAANVVYARGHLPEYLDREQIRYHRFETFHDVIAHLGTFRGPSDAKVRQGC